MTRLQRFRELIARMDPIATPESRLEFYVEPPQNSLSNEIASRFELEPAASQALVGGIGTGKSTEVLRAVKRIQTAVSELPDHATYVDVSRHHVLDGHRPGVLVALVAVILEGLASKVGRKKSSSLITLLNFARGHTTWEVDPSYFGYSEDDHEPNFDEPDADPGPPEIPVQHEGVLQPPVSATPNSLGHLVEPLRSALADEFQSGGSLFVAFDGLDRLATEAFKTMVLDDIRVLKRAGVGVLVVAPGRAAFGHERTLLDLFDRVHQRPAFDISQEGVVKFLRDVLTKRAPDHWVLADEVTSQLARLSSGFLRDLLALARDSAESAYVAGRENITLEDVTRAGTRYGESLAFGTSDAELAVMRKVIRSSRLVVRGALEAGLVDRRALVPYAGPQSERWAVHAALQDVLQRSGSLGVEK